jgi:hypothetical protein
MSPGMLLGSRVIAELLFEADPSENVHWPDITN